MVKTSLVEAYDDRDVIRQISKLTDEVKADTEVITEKATAIDTALPKVEKAVEDAEDASTKAQAAAATALGIGDRVTAVENSAAQNHSDITVLDGEVTDINNDLTNVVRKVTSDVQKVNKGLRVGEVPAGDDVVISRKVLQDFIDAYEAMVRTSGNQRVDGNKLFIRGTGSSTNYRQSAPPTSGVIHSFPVYWEDLDGYTVAIIEPILESSGKIALYAQVRNSDGTVKGTTLIESDR